MDIQGKNRYVNLGSVGCYDRPEVRIDILDIAPDEISLEKLSVPYNDNGLMEEYDKRRVPARDFITKTFITRA
jgi:hypothetical protein